MHLKLCSLLLALAGQGSLLDRDFHALFEEGDLAFQAGDYDRAIAAYADALEIKPLAADCAYNIACCLARLDDVDGSLLWLERAAERFYGRPWWHLDQMLEDLDLAVVRKDPRFLDVFDRAQKNWFEDMDSQVRLALERLDADRADLAIDWLERAVLGGWGSATADVEFLRSDPRLEPLRGGGRFTELLERAERRLAGVHRSMSPPPSPGSSGTTATAIRCWRWT